MATNISILCGRWTKDTEVRYSGENAIATNTLAVPEDYKPADGTPHTNFISVTAFGKKAEFMEKYARKGAKFIVTGRIRTGSYKNKDGITVYTTDVVAESFEFAESKKDGSSVPTQTSDPAPAVAQSQTPQAPQSQPAAPQPVAQAQPVVPAPVETPAVDFGEFEDVFA